MCSHAAFTCLREAARPSARQGRYAPVCVVRSRPRGGTGRYRSHGAGRALAVDRDPANVAAMTPHPDRAALQASLHRDGFAFVTADTMRQLLPMQDMDDWGRFAASWNDLAPDTYLAALGRHRRRRHAVFAADASGEIRREPHQPHYQSLAYSRELFGTLAPTTRRWHIEVHQFRIEARADEAGEPTPEGVHRDGVDYV